MKQVTKRALLYLGLMFVTPTLYAHILGMIYGSNNPIIFTWILIMPLVCLSIPFIDKQLDKKYGICPETEGRFN